MFYFGISMGPILSNKDKKENLKRLKFENGDIIPDLESYLT
jgi:hypothetical protein